MDVRREQRVNGGAGTIAVEAPEKFGAMERSGVLIVKVNGSVACALQRESAEALRDLLVDVLDETSPD
jgi:hypothetical protein